MATSLLKLDKEWGVKPSTPPRYSFSRLACQFPSAYDLKYSETSWQQVSLHWFVFASEQAWILTKNDSNAFVPEWKHNKCSVALTETSTISQNWEKSVESLALKSLWGIIQPRLEGKEANCWGCRVGVDFLLLFDGCKSGDPARGSTRACDKSLACLVWVRKAIWPHVLPKPWLFHVSVPFPTNRRFTVQFIDSLWLFKQYQVFHFQIPN